VVTKERDVKVRATVLKNKSQVAIATAFEELLSQLSYSKTAVDMRLSVTVDQITNGKQALDSFGLWQVTQAADYRWINGEKLSQKASLNLAPP
jgi:hypothetical protein